MSTTVLTSGGLDSAVLLAHIAQQDVAHPLHINVGLVWEPAEREMLHRLLAHERFASNVAPLETLSLNMADVYGPTHWAVQGTPPAYDTADEEVYLAGRNLVLLAKAGVFAAARNISRIALGPLAGNPFPDATPQFFDAMAHALTIGLNHSIQISTPFLLMEKDEVIRLGESLGVPLELTLSCMNPVHGSPPLHCGDCSKCRERRDAFEAAHVIDRARYAQPGPV